ncbi:MAG: PIN domain-containing protein [Arcobacteraceae bacterium]|nr:PIN domain-containing protein [Arcobacteraceae bacterium]
MILLDANYILRFLLKDNLEMYEISKDCIANNNCTIPNEVLAEVVFVLLKVYKVIKKDITKSLINILEYDNIIMNDKHTIIQSLEIFETKNLDFVDCILCAKSEKYIVKTFDKKLNKCITNNQA